jgi:tRNA A37 threonylcarbamoyltransferase TsaD
MAALGVELHVPARELCTDNAAMIAAAALNTPAVEFPGYLALDAYSR